MRLIISIVLLCCVYIMCNPAHAITYEQQTQKQAQAALATADGAQIKSSVIKHSESYKVDPLLIYAVILTESGFRKNAVSSAGCIGLMQLAPSTFKARNVGTNIYDIDQNVHAGTKHLSGLIARYNGDIYRALAAYNMGGGNVYKDKPIPAVGKLYVDKVMYHKKILESVAL